MNNFGLSYLYEAQTEWGQWVVHHTGPQSFIMMLSYLLALQHWGLLIGWSFSRVFKRSNHYLYSTEVEIWCITIRDIHQFISHCLIPLEPRLKLLLNYL